MAPDSEARAAALAVPPRLLGQLSWRAQRSSTAAVSVPALPMSASRLTVVAAGWLVYRQGWRPSQSRAIHSTPRPSLHPSPPAGGCRNGELLVTLKPMEVRTFNLLYKPY